MKFTVEGADHELPRALEAEYGDAFKAACEAMRKALEIFRSPGYDERDGWKVDCSNEYITVYYKDIDGLRYYAAKAIISLPASKLIDMHWNELGDLQNYNDNMKYGKTIRKLADDVDIAQYASNDKLMVKSREFLVGRMRKNVGTASVLACRSCNIDAIPPSKESVRAFLHVGSASYSPCPEDPDNSCVYDYLFSVDLKGMLLKTVANQALGKLVLSDVENNRVHAIKISPR
ncbi:hypothetical protein Q1695_009107 [Nippostrongylus brasiliensis]|nr:hypothetical protein Q1695_009107 [Nippostrongylus brasiliensis]